MKIIEKLKDFIENDKRNEWLSDGLMNVYVRKGYHFIEGKTKICLDIANVVVYKQKQGTWTKFLWEAHKINPWYCTFVECVNNKHLVKWLLKNGFTETNESFYLKTGEKDD